MAQNVSKVFRVFFSSTFSDFQEERNELQKTYFPMLDRFCRENGAVFQAVDLRWGISEEASLDNRTLEICLNEVKLCHEISPRPSFIILLGDRYGWCPVPPSVPAEKFEQLHFSDFARSWYIKDENAVPPVYHLRRREGIYSDRREWAVVEEKLRKEWETLDAPLQSATEEEIHYGLDAPWEDRKHIFCFKRKLENIPFSAEGAKYTDLVNVGGEYISDEEKKEKRLELETFIKSRLPEENIETFTADWEHRGENVSVFCREMADRLLESIKEELNRLQTLDVEVESEISEAAFSEVCMEDYTGQEILLGQLMEHMLHGEGMALVRGECGKSALAAKMGDLLHGAGYNVIVRHARQSTSSADLESLLSSICRKLDISWTGDLSEGADDIQGKLEQSGTFLILDGIDRYPQASLILYHLSSCHYVLATVSSPQIAGVLGIRQEYHIEQLTQGELVSLFDTYLLRQGRTLTAAQREAFIQGLEKNPSAVFCKLAARRAAMMSSFDEPIIVNSPEELADSVFSAMTDIYNHDPILAEHVIGILACVEELSPVDLIEMSMRDQTAYQEWSKQLYFRLPREEIPINVISRLYYDLAPYLLHKPFIGQEIICFASDLLQTRARQKYVNDFIAEHALQIYLSRNQSALSPSELSRIPYLFSKYKTGRELTAWITSSQHIRSIVSIGLLPELMEELAALSAEPEAMLLRRCLQEKRDVFLRRPDASDSIVRMYGVQHRSQKGMDRLLSQLPEDDCMYSDCFEAEGISPYFRLEADNTYWIFCCFTESGTGLLAMKLDGSFWLFDINTGKVSSSLPPTENLGFFMYGCRESGDSLIALSRDKGVFRLKAPDYEHNGLDISVWEKLKLEGENFFGMTGKSPLTIGRSVKNWKVQTCMTYIAEEVELVHITPKGTEIIPLDFLAKPSVINAIDVSASGDLAIAFMDGQIAATTGLFVEKSNMDRLIDCTFYDNDTGVAACSATGQLYCYHSDGGLRFKADISIPGLFEQHCEQIIWNEKRRLLIVGHRNGWVTVIPADQPKNRERFFSGMRQGIIGMAISPDGEQLVLGGRGGVGSGLGFYKMEEIEGFRDNRLIKNIYGEFSVSGCGTKEGALFQSQFRERVTGDYHVFSVSSSHPAEYDSIATADCYAWDENRKRMFFSRGPELFVWKNGAEKIMMKYDENITGIVLRDQLLILVMNSTVKLMAERRYATFRLTHARTRRAAPVLAEGNSLFVVCETEKGELEMQSGRDVKAKHPDSYVDVYDLDSLKLTESEEYDGFCNFVGMYKGQLLLGLGEGYYCEPEATGETVGFIRSQGDSGAVLCGREGRMVLCEGNVACGLSDEQGTILVFSSGDTLIIYPDGRRKWVTVCAEAVAVFRGDHSINILDNGEQNGGRSRLHRFSIIE